MIARLVFHYTNEAGNLSPASTKEMHISTVLSPPIYCIPAVTNLTTGRRNPQQEIRMEGTNRHNGLCKHRSREPRIRSAQARLRHPRGPHFRLHRELLRKAKRASRRAGVCGRDRGEKRLATTNDIREMLESGHGQRPQDQRQGARR